MYSGQNLYPSASIVANGVFYVGSYSAFDDGGRFNGFRWSRNWNHWEEQLKPGWTSEYWTDGRKPETDFFARDVELRRFNNLHAVQFGQDNQLSPDGRIYFTGHGQIPGGMSNWDKGDAIYLCRVASDPKAVSDPASYEFFAGRLVDGRALWTRDVARAAPILEWKGHLGSESITYVPGLQKYLLTAARLKERENNLPYDVLTFWEADKITGPYRLVHYLRDWGPQAYFPILPSRFISSDGLTMWLCVSCNYSAKVQRPFGCRYAASLHEIVLDLEGQEPTPLPPPPGPEVGHEAQASASSCAPGTLAEAINDGRGTKSERGVPEWGAGPATDEIDGKSRVWVQLTWKEPRLIECVRLFDRPDTQNWIHSGVLRFSDGTREPVRAWLSNRALAPTEIRFAPRKVSWLRFEIGDAEGNEPGLVELQVFAPLSKLREIHVSVRGKDGADGSAERPLRTISAAAAIAMPGDTVTVHEGIYRERVDPPRGGEPGLPITYRGAPGELAPIIRGSEIVTGWEPVRAKPGVWTVSVPAERFGELNPFADEVHGDWFLDHGRKHHTGAVYVRGKWLYEAIRLEDVFRDPDEAVEDYLPTQSFYLFNVAWLSYGASSRRVPAASFGEHKGVGKAPSSEGGECIGYIEHGEWVRYAGIAARDVGKELRLRVASGGAGGRIEIRVGGPRGERLGRVDVPPTGGWQNWQTVTASLQATEAEGDLCLVFRSPAGPTPKDFALWFARVEEERTQIWAQFGELDPNREQVEFNVRQSVFYPSKPGIDFIHVRGIRLERAATPWAPPTAEQIGLIGTHWSKGWVIENNTIRHSTCVGLTLGKYGDEFDNTSQNRASGYVETIQRALQNGWTSRHIGHDIVRDNEISHCEQAGIVGSLGAVFSEIRGSYVHEILVRRLFGGAEMAGIKLHAPIDCVIANNRIEKTTRGLWLDWMTQGTRVHGNVFASNVPQGDFYTEVNHGPFLVDHNLFLSPNALEIRSHGGAYAHNLVAGRVTVAHGERRQTPWHAPHSTQLGGIAAITSGEDRFFGNIFVRHGLDAYDGAKERLTSVGNVYLARAKPPQAEAAPLVMNGPMPQLVRKVSKNRVQIMMQLPAALERQHVPLVNTQLLGKARLPNMPFVHPDGSPITLNHDLIGRLRDPGKVMPGPIQMKKGEEKAWLDVWRRGGSSKGR
jgi:alpha-N-arabinofuranosidase